MSFITSPGVVGFTNQKATTAPNNVIPVSYFIASGGAVSIDVAIGPKGQGGLSSRIPDNTAVGGNKRGVRAVDWQLNRAAATAVASGVESTIGGGVNNTSSASQTTVSGGQDNIASGQLSSVIGGNGNNASGMAVSIIGGQFNLASGTDTVVGGRQGTDRGAKGVFVWSSEAESVAGDAQMRYGIYRRATGDAVPVILTSTNSAASPSNVMVLPNSSSFTFVAYVNATQYFIGGGYAAFKLEGLISRGANAGTTAIVGAVIVTPIASVGAVGWTVTALADNVLGALVLQVTGVAGTLIKWVAKLECIENRTA